jgi:hypothetical protein
MTYVKSAFPRFTASDFSRLLELYGFASSSSPDRLDSLYDTLGDRGPTALNQSEFATGYQQTAFNIFAETAFDCPSYWLADAFSGNNDKERLEVSVLGHSGISRSRLDSVFLRWHNNTNERYQACRSENVGEASLSMTLQ